MKTKILLICAMAAAMAVSCGKKDAAADNTATAEAQTENAAAPAAPAASATGDAGYADFSEQPRNSNNVILLDADNILVKGHKLDKVTVVDFNATWCMPCKKFEPAFNEVAAETDKADFVSVDVDKCPQTAQSFEIVSVPTVLIIGKDGEIKARYEGVGELLPADAFRKIVNANL